MGSRIRFVKHAAQLLCAAAAFGVAAAATATTLGSPMVLKDEGMFFVNGEVVTSNYPSVPATGAPTPGSIVINQMFVHYRLPLAKRYGLPVVLVHGGGLTGMSYETTPDGREGWATYFTRRGFDTYVVDFPGRGRAGFDPTIINQAKYENNASLLPSISRTLAQTAWVNFRFGPSFGTAFPDVLFPVDNIADFGAQGVPGADVTLEGGSLQQAPAAIAALLDRIGPAILFVHSQSGPFADRLVTMRPSLIKCVVNVEGSQNVTPTDEQVAAYKGIPDLELFGDYVDVDVSTGKPRYEARTLVAQRINAAGGDAEVVTLPDVGMQGNTHMLMQDKNNLQIADWIIRWLSSKGCGGR